MGAEGKRRMGVQQGARKRVKKGEGSTFNLLNHPILNKGKK